MAQLTVLNNIRKPSSRAEGSSDSRGPIGDAERAVLAAELVQLCGADGSAESSEVRFGQHDRLLYSTDASLYQVEPIGVVVPGSIDAAERVVKWGAARGVAMLPRGGGTSLAGQCTNHAVVIDLTPRCRAIRSVNVEARTCEVEPGIGVDELNDQLSKRGAGLFFAPDPATTRQAAIGGCIGNNAAGARSIRYGRTSENIERLEVCLGSGERVWLGPNAGRTSEVAKRLGEGVLRVVREHAAQIRERFPKTIRRNAGYGLDMILDQADAGATGETVDLAKLLCGSEGTLAVTLGAVLKLHPVPRAKGLMVISFATLEDAIAATAPILHVGVPRGLTAVELLDDVVLDAARGNSEVRKYVELLPGADAARGEPKAALYVEFFGFAGGAEDVEAGFAAIRGLISLTSGVLPNGVAAYTDTGAMMKAWALRRAGEPLLHGLPGARKPITFVEDNAVPVERLGEFVREFKKIVAKHGTRAAYWAHASVGVLHVRPMIDLHDPADRERMLAIAVEVADLARSCGGIMSGEHGDGRVRGPLIERFFGPDLMQAFREVKALFDPQGLLNPGNIVMPGPIGNITENLRVDAAEVGQSVESKVKSAPVSTYFDYSDSDGFAHAVEQCNGAGVCRKRGGVMCPSYQATLDERHSTRGRGNALRLAVTGQFGAMGGVARANEGGPNWNDAETIKTLDLCLSCKACKSECPSNVDIAKLKAEYTAQRYRESGRVPIPAFATGHVRVLNRIGAMTPKVANWFNTTSVARAFINRVMRIHPQRSLPKFSRSLYKCEREFASDRGSRAQGPAIFADCFTTYNESHIGLAAGRALKSLGYSPKLVPSGSAGAKAKRICCGRSMISVGMLDQAIAHIDSAVEQLWSHVAAGGRDSVLIVCEPSCLSAIKDDWLSLNCHSSLEKRKLIAERAMLPEEFVEKYWGEHPDQSALRRAEAAAATPGPPVMLHGHCHQKSLWGTDLSVKVLRRLVGNRLQTLDTGCCGMAGSFGYGEDRFDLSMKIGELSLFPLVRNATSDAVVIAPGTSCRHQLHDGVGCAARHPIELIADLLAEDTSSTHQG